MSFGNHSLAMAGCLPWQNVVRYGPLPRFPIGSVIDCEKSLTAAPSCLQVHDREPHFSKKHRALDYTCTPSYGAVCKADPANGRYCEDIEIRFYCPNRRSGSPFKLAGESLQSNWVGWQDHSISDRGYWTPWVRSSRMAKHLK